MAAVEMDDVASLHGTVGAAVLRLSLLVLCDGSVAPLIRRNSVRSPLQRPRSAVNLAVLRSHTDTPTIPWYASNGRGQGQATDRAGAVCPPAGNTSHTAQPTSRGLATSG